MDEEGTISISPDMKKMRGEMFRVSVSDDETRLTIAETYNKYGIVLEPHGAVAWQGLNKFLEQQGSSYSEACLSIALETAHPAKFPAELAEIIEKDISTS